MSTLSALRASIQDGDDLEAFSVYDVCLVIKFEPELMNGVALGLNMEVLCIEHFTSQVAYFAILKSHFLNHTVHFLCV
jgi:hypothetical protein